MRTTVLVIACLSLIACQSTPSGPPEEVAGEIVLALDAMQQDKAENLFARVPEKDRDSMYPILYDEAKARYQMGDTAGSSALLRFMAESYPEALAARQALLYSLFVERGKEAEASPALLEETERTILALREQSSDLPVWVELVETQLRIDQNRLQDARESFDRFLANWSGEPQDLLAYVEDIDRYLQSH